jgi:hypothetical protein
VDSARHGRLFEAAESDESNAERVAQSFSIWSYFRGFAGVLARGCPDAQWSGRRRRWFHD